MPIDIQQAVLDKLREKHKVSQKEVFDCFANGEGLYFIDTSEDHRTDPPTQWFMAPTNQGRILKVCFIRKGNLVEIKTAFEPSSDRHLKLYIQMANLPKCWPDEE